MIIHCSNPPIFWSPIMGSHHRFASKLLEVIDMARKCCCERFDCAGFAVFLSALSGYLLEPRKWESNARDGLCELCEQMLTDWVLMSEHILTTDFYPMRTGRVEIPTGKASHNRSDGSLEPKFTKTSEKHSDIVDLSNDGLWQHQHQQQPTTNNQQPTTNHQPPTTNNQQPTTNNQQPTTNHQQPTTNHQQPTTNHQPPTTNHQQTTNNKQQPTTNNNNKCTSLRILR